MSEASVAPGQIAVTFVFKVASASAGSGASSASSFQVVAEGASWLGPVMWRDFTELRRRGHRGHIRLSIRLQRQLGYARVLRIGVSCRSCRRMV